jgi:hypothetical protein
MSCRLTRSKVSQSQPPKTGGREQTVLVMQNDLPRSSSVHMSCNAIVSTRARLSSTCHAAWCFPHQSCEIDSNFIVHSPAHVMQINPQSSLPTTAAHERRPGSKPRSSCRIALPRTSSLHMSCNAPVSSRAHLRSPSQAARSSPHLSCHRQTARSPPHLSCAIEHCISAHSSSLSVVSCKHTCVVAHGWMHSQGSSPFICARGHPQHMSDVAPGWTQSRVTSLLLR